MDAALRRVLDRGWYVLGPEVDAFEQAFGAYHGEANHAVAVGSGTDAIALSLRAVGVGPGDEVLVPANAGIPPVAAIVAMGARPVFCDVDAATHTLDPAEISMHATPASRAVLVVHLYGRMAAVEAIAQQAAGRGLRLIEDCAQAHGAELAGRKAGTWGDAAAFSFYPTKNLGALGDGGAVLTRSAATAEQVRLLRNYGWKPQYVSHLHATNSRLDELQAAVLRAKLPHLDRWNDNRRQLAAVYCQELADVTEVVLPEQPADAAAHVRHLFVLRAGARRDELRAGLTARNIASAIHYPLPAHLQAPYRVFGQGEGSLPRTEQLAAEVLSLPLYPGLPVETVRWVARQVRNVVQHGA